MQTETNEKLWKVKDVAGYLGVSGTWVYMLIGQGELATVRVGSRSIRVTDSSLRVFLNRQNKKGG